MTTWWTVLSTLKILSLTVAHDASSEISEAIKPNLACKSEGKLFLNSFNLDSLRDEIQTLWPASNNERVMPQQDKNDIKKFILKLYIKIFFIPAPTIPVPPAT